MTSTETPILIHRVLPEHWRSHRDLRLEMLQDAPDYFWTTHEQVVGRTEGEWREEITGSRTFLQAVRRRPEGDEVLGGVAIDPVGYTEEMALPADTINVVSLYVRPAHRGGEVTRALFRGILEVMRELGRDRLLLETPEDNERGRRRYLDLGFRETGFRSPDPRREGLDEVEYEARTTDLRLG